MLVSFFLLFHVLGLVINKRGEGVKKEMEIINFFHWESQTKSGE